MGFDRKTSIIIIVSLLIGYFLAVGEKILSDDSSVERDADNVITVTGMAEKEVIADKLIYPLTFVARGYDLTELATKIDNDTKEIMQFLKEKGFSENEISVANFSLEYDDDKESGKMLARGLAMKSSDSMPLLMSNNSFGESLKSTTDEQNQGEKNKKEDNPLYFMTKKISLKTNKLKQVNELVESLNVLIHKGVNVYGNSNIEYIFSDLESLKFRLYDEATKNGIKTAEAILKSSDSEICSIKRINQGQLIVRDDPYDQAKKKVSVQNLMEFYLED